MQSSQGPQRRGSVGQDQNNLVIKNTFNPPVSHHASLGQREIGPLTSVKVPENIREALSKKAEPDNFFQMIQAESNRSPKMMGQTL
jgi:hypothetical protein